MSDGKNKKSKKKYFIFYVYKNNGNCRSISIHKN